MRLNTIFLTLYFQFGNVFAPPPSNLEFLLSLYQFSNGFLCGNSFYEDTEVLDVKRTAEQNFGKGLRFPQEYKDDVLHSEVKYKKYFQYPIRKIGGLYLPNVKAKTFLHMVIFNRNKDELEVVDVIAKLTYYDSAKCIRINTGLVTPSPVAPDSEPPNGYQCGRNKFIDDQMVEKTHERVLEDRNNFYPAPSFGNIFRADLGYQIWPIFRKGPMILYKNGGKNIGRYFLVLDKKYRLVNVVVKGHEKELFICIKSRKHRQAPASDPLSELFVPPPLIKYQCGKISFNEEVVLKIADTIKYRVESNPKKIGTYLHRHEGPPFNERGFIVTITKDGQLYEHGARGPFRMIFTPTYQIIGLAMFVNNELKACNKEKISGHKKHDISNYQCYKKTFRHDQLVAAANQACTKMKRLVLNFPAMYRGPKFMDNGDYFTFPVIDGELFGGKNRNPGPYRVAINSKCEVVGGIHQTFHSDR
ncbi:putative guanyl-specific ribonuclease f1 [Erysiphe neolycopersici]|uniref:Putative guanyl-specific ribonuclease f1 n=1 Tax=Erysiphe neolycopersici TaxID=212602 RepID=A0A420HT67_9PEZI|nr:putative guanyl-specific ribonuclease f1 [Erysiphe neolycopersici]